MLGRHFARIPGDGEEKRDVWCIPALGLVVLICAPCCRLLTALEAWGSELLIVPQVHISNLCGEKPQGLWEEEAPGPAHPSRSVTGKAALGAVGYPTYCRINQLIWGLLGASRDL